MRVRQYGVVARAWHASMGFSEKQSAFSRNRSRVSRASPRADPWRRCGRRLPPRRVRRRIGGTPRDGISGATRTSRETTRDSVRTRRLSLHRCVVYILIHANGQPGRSFHISALLASVGSVEHLCRWFPQRIVVALARQVIQPGNGLPHGSDKRDDGVLQHKLENLAEVHHRGVLFVVAVPQRGVFTSAGMRAVVTLVLVALLHVPEARDAMHNGAIRLELPCWLSAREVFGRLCFGRKGGDEFQRGRAEERASLCFDLRVRETCRATAVNSTRARRGRVLLHGSWSARVEERSMRFSSSGNQQCPKGWGGRVVGARGGPETKRGARGRRVGDTPEVRERSIVSRPRGLVGTRRVLTLPETSNADSDNADSE